MPAPAEEKPQSPRGEKSGTPPKASAGPYEQLKKLAQLKEEGILTEEEFAKLKADYLSKL